MPKCQTLKTPPDELALNLQPGAHGFTRRDAIAWGRFAHDALRQRPELRRVRIYVNAQLFVEMERDAQPAGLVPGVSRN